jgi:hypothetical protein
VSPSFRRIAPVIIGTFLYWPVALFVLGLSQMGDCFADAATCESGRTTGMLQLGAIETALYALIIYLLVRFRVRL